MGNNDSKQDSSRLASKYAFNEKELTYIKKIYDEISAIDNNHNSIQKSALEAKFPENPSFAAKLYKCMASKSVEGNVTFDSFVRILEIFTKDPEEYKLAAGFNHFERIEIFVLASLQKFEVSKDQVSKLKLSYSDSIVIVSDFLKIFKNEGEIDDDESGAKVVTNQIFEDKQGQLDYEFYLFQLKDRMRFANKIITYYILSKFVDPTYSRYLKLPKLDSPSTILTKQLLTLLWLNNPQFQKIENLNLLYSMATKGTSFNRLSYFITGYAGPTLFVLKHKDKEPVVHSGEEDSSVFVFGAYMNTIWKEELNYQGDNDTFIFSLLPKYKQYQTYKGEGGKNYSYFNTHNIPNSIYKQGLGFGGSNFENFRIWIDEDMENQSYCQPNDTTYEKGFLVRPDISKLNIQEIEVWGLGGAEALQQQEKFREFQAEQIENSRKVDKRKFVDNQFDKEILFEKTFQGTNNKDQGST